ncbi:MAG: phosphatidylglycerophosphatase A [Magnetococcales bacterium]|nr:phosphatidylglycerophosphatase A [Magnetococcales bacterium]
MAVFIATLGGVGKLPKAPGTLGTLATLPLCYLVLEWGLISQLLVLLLVTVVGTWAADVSARVMGNKDPKQVVVDESAGILLTLLAAPPGWLWLGAGFLLFRLFDIWKPWPVGWLDHNLTGGVGIMADDLAAGLYAWFLLNIVYGLVG